MCMLLLISRVIYELYVYCDTVKIMVHYLRSNFIIMIWTLSLFYDLDEVLNLVFEHWLIMHRNLLNETLNKKNAPFPVIINT